MQIFTKPKHFLFFALFLTAFSAYAQDVVVTQGTANNICIGGAAVPLPTIVIQEDVSAPEAIGGVEVNDSQAIVLQIDPAFEFVPGIGSVSVSAGDVFLGSYSITATSITINLTVQNSGGGDVQDNITISGLQIRAKQPGSPTTAFIIRNDGEALSITDFPDGTQVGTLTSVATPTATISSDDADDTICAGTSVTFTASPAGEDNYEFFVNGLSVQNGGSDTYVTSALLNGQSVSVEVTNTAGCSDVSSGILMTVNPNPVVSLTSTDTDNIICEGTNVIFIATPLGATSYDFRVNGSTVQNTASNQYATTSLNDTDEVDVIVTLPNTCSATSSAINMTVNANPTPTLVSSDADNTICADASVTFTAGPAAQSNYEFFVDGLSVQTGTSATYATSTLNSGQAVSVSVTTSDNCTVTSGSITTTVNPNPVVSLTSSDADNTICAGTSVTFTATPLSAANYDFQVNMISVQSGTSNQFITTSLTNGQNVRVVVTLSSGCSATSSIIPMTVNPNPATTLSSSDADNTICEGALVIFTAGPAAQSNYEFFVDGLSVQSGTSPNYATSTLTNGQAVRVRVTNASTCSVLSSAITTTVNPNPIVSLTSSDADNIICAGASVVFTATPLGAAAYNFRVNGSTVQNTASNTYTTTSLAHNDNVTVIVTLSTGCNTTSSPAINMTVNPNPVPTLVSSDADNTICAGVLVTFTASPAAQSNYEFFVDGLSVQTGTSPNYATSTLTNGQAVRVRVTNASTCSVLSSAITTTVNPNPIVSLTSSDADNIICAGASVVFTATPLGAAAYNFRVNGSTVQNTASNTYTTTSLAHNDNVTVIVTLSTGCNTTSSPAINMTVNPNPVPTLVSSDADNTICAGALVTFTASPAAQSNYEFFVDGLSVQTGTSPNYATSTLTNGQAVRVRVTNASTCSVLSSAITTTVNPNPIVSLTSSDADNIICAGASVVFTATPLGAAAYNFRVNGSTVQNTASNTYTTTSLAHNDNVTVIVTLSTGCNTTSSPAINMTVNPNPVPTLVSSDADNTICAGALVTFTASPAAQSNYEFFVDGLSVQTGTSPNYATSTLTNGQAVRVRVTNASTCSVLSSAITTTVNPNPIVSLTSSDADNIICAGASVVFTATPLGAAAYNFRVNGSTVQNTASNTYTTTSLAHNDNVTVIVTLSTGCNTTSSPAINMTVNPNPVPTLVSSDADNTICAGVLVTFTASPAAQSNYEFFVDGLSVQTGTSPNYATSTLTNGQAVRVRVTNASTCSVLSSAITTTVNPNPIVSLTSSDADNIICAGASVVFTATPLGAAAYNFRVNGSTVQNTASNTYTTTSLAHNDNVTVIVTLSTGCNTTSSPAINMTVNPNPVPTLVSSDADNTICAGALVTFTASPAAQSNYEFFVDGLSVQTGTSPNYATSTLTNGQAVRVRVTNSSTCSVLSSAITTTVNPNPIVSLTSSDADNIICAGTSVVFTATPLGAAAYNFRVNGSTVQNTASNTYTTTSLAHNDNVTVIVTLSTGCNTTSSPAINMTVNPNPVPTLVSSDADNTICAGALVTFTASPAAQSNYEFFVDGLSVQTGTSPNYATSTLTNGQAVRVRVTNSSTCSVLSSAITTTVNPNPIVSLTSSDADNIICAGTSVTFTATPLSAANYDFQVNMVSVQSGTSNQYTTASLTNTQNVRVVVTLSTGCNAASAQIPMTVNPNPTPVITGTPMVCANQSGVTYQVTNTAGRTYNWSVTGGNITAGATTSTITVTWGSGSAGIVHLTETINSTGCSTVAANYNVTINPNPVVAAIANQIACNGATNAAISLSANTGGGETFNWSGGSALGLPDGSDNSSPFAIPSFTTLNIGSSPVSAVVSVTATKAGCTGPVQNFTVTVNPTPAFTITNTTNSICEGTAANITLTSSTTNAVITLVSATYAGATGGTYVGGETFNTGQRINETLGNPTESPITVTYVFSVAANGCTNPTTQQATVTINPAPPVFSITNTTPAICTGAATNITLNSPTLNAQVRLDAVTYGAASGSPALVVGTLYNTGQTIAQTLTNTTNAPVTVTYTFSVSANGCGNPVTQQTTVIVNPSPAFTITNITNSICEGTAANITLTSPTTNAVITLVSATYAGATGGTYAGGETFNTGQRINETLGNPTESPITVTYVFRVGANGCNNPTTQQTTVTINPAPPVFSIANTTPAICTGAATNITLNSPTLNAQVKLDAVTYGAASGSPALVVGTLYNTGQTIAQTLTNTTNAPVTVTYTFSVSANGCSNPVTQQTTVIVNPSPAFTITNTTNSICEGTAANITLTSPTTNAVITLVSATYAGATGGTYAGGETFNTGQRINETLGNPTESPITVTYVFSVAANGCTNPTTQQATVTINPAPPVFSIANTTPSICTGAATSITLNSPTSNAQIRLDAVNFGAASGSPSIAIGTVYTTGQTIAQTLTNTTNAPVTVMYTFSVSANTCSNPVQQTTTVQVNPSPAMSITNATPSICSNTAVGITLNSPTSGATIRLISVNYNGASGTLTAPRNYTPGSIITESLINPTNNPINVTYSFDVSANGCSTAGPFTTVVEVKPSPVFSITNASPQVCEGTATNITLNTPTASAQVRLDAVNYNGATGTLSAGQLFANGQKITEVLVNPTNFPITVTYTFSVSIPGCNNPVQQTTQVTITRSPTVVVPGDYTVCEPVTIPLTGTIGASAVSGLWSVITGGGTLSATNVSGTTVTANYTVAAADIGNVVTLRLTTSDPDGPTGPCTAVFDDINITINRKANITAGIDLQQCRDQASIQLQGAITYAPNGVSWSGGTGMYSNVTSPTSNYSFNNPSEVNTTRTLTLTANDPDGAGPCSTVSDQMLLRIYPLPTVVFSGLPAEIAENASPAPELFGNQSGGNFTIAPATSSIPSTTHTPVDKVVFDPSAAELGVNFITYTYTDVNGCTNSQTQQVIVNPVTDIEFTLQYASGSLAGQFIPLNGSGGFDFCGEIGNVRIVGNPDASTGQNPTNFLAVGANAATLQAKISQVGADYFINTNGLPPDNYSLQYTYTNSLGVTSPPFTRAITVFPSPVAVIDNLLNNCIDSGIEFKDASDVAAPAVIDRWFWDFGDGNTSSLENPPAHEYDEAGVYTVNLTVTTNQRCSNSTALTIRVGDVPVVDFAWSAICTNDNTKFQDETTDPGGISTIIKYSWDFGDGDVIVGAPGDIIPPGTNGGRTTGTFEDPEHKYVTAGTKNVVLSVETNDGCNNSKPKSISILVSGSTVTPTALDPYENNFEVADSEWVPEGFEISTDPDVFSNQSWRFGVPTGAIINASVAANGTTSAWWTGSNANSYYPSEESAVNGPCFNLMQLSRPMISLDYWSDAEQNLDGAALQYSTDGGLNWHIVGPAASTPNEGINWYRGQTVQSNPGRQPFGSNGWTGKLTGWRNGRFNLDMIPPAERDQVRLRVAFASNNTNDPSKTFDGFAFDNVVIGERKRNVMVEYFTNAGILSATNKHFDNLYAAQFIGPLAKDSTDFFKIQYHIANPSEDPINEQNPVDPAARSLFYGISQPPSAVMDGILGNYYGTNFNGNYLTITEEELERRALEDPLFDIKLDTLVSGSSTIKFHAEFTYKHPTIPLSSSLIVHAALIEDHVGTSDERNVLRKLLLGTEGYTITRSWGLNQMESIDREIEIDAPIGTNNGNLYLVVFIQDKRFNSKEIHQAVRIKLHRKSAAVITGIDDPVLEQVKDIAIYPNPATRVVNFAKDTELTRDYQYTIVDQRGVTVLSGNLNRYLMTPQQVELSNLADGMYIVMIHQGNRRLTQRKLVVLKR